MRSSVRPVRYSKVFRASLLRLFAPRAATGFGRQVSFSQVAYAVWRGNRPVRLCFRIHHYPSEVSAYSIQQQLHHHETSGTLEPPKPVPSSLVFQWPELYVHFPRERCSNGASLSAFQSRLARVFLIRAVLSSDTQSPFIVS